MYSLGARVTILMLLMIVKGVPIHEGVEQSETLGPPASPWLNRVKNPRVIGCRERPWICNKGQRFPPFKNWCCRNRCIDVTSDVNNCGFCGIRCPFTWQCCRGLCIDTSINPFHCGKCWNICTFGSLCFYGMCSYALPLPPFPFSLPPLPPTPFPSAPPKIEPPQKS